MDPSDAQDSEPQRCLPARRVILVGASNLVIGLPQVIEAAWCQWGRPLDILAAIGHGRSYGRPSRVLWRGLSGILDCGLWEALAQRHALPTAALVTDIGNDILYGVPLETILQWVETCLRRITAVSDRLLVTALPMESVERVGPIRFGLMRRLLFPRSRLRLETVRQIARVLNSEIHTLARRHAARVVLPSADWYGIDPIHIRRSQRTLVWRNILGQWEHPLDLARQRVTLREQLILRRMKPQERMMFGQTQHHVQPAAVLSDGTSIALY